MIAGLAAIFIANAIGAVLEPAPYRHILKASPITSALHLDQTWMTILIALNDAAIGLALVASRAQRQLTSLALGLAGAWLAVASLLKITASIT